MDTHPPGTPDLELQAGKKGCAIEELFTQVEALRARLAELAPGMTLDLGPRQPGRKCIHCDQLASSEGYWRLG